MPAVAVPPPDPRAVLTRSAPPPDRVVRYGEAPEHVADVRLPGERHHDAPLVVVVHGGFWRPAFDRAHAAAQSQGLADAGYAVATIEYRRAGQAGGGWPGTFDDVAAAVDAVPALAAAAGGVDAGRVVLVGHSAGGQLAVWAAARHHLPPGSRWARQRDEALVGVVSLAGVLDLRAAREAHLGDGAVDALLGDHDGADVDPARLPLPDATTVLVHGADDQQVPVRLSRDYAASHPGAHLVDLPGVEHFALIDPLSVAWPAVLEAVRTACEPPTTLTSRALR